MDEDPEKTAALNSSGDYDLLTLTVSPTSISGLKEAGVPYADLFIAVTPEESRNMTSCMIAHTLGAKKTVARVDNSEYLLPNHMETFRQMGVDSLIYPEVLAASEILESLKRLWVRQYWEVKGGALIMMAVKLRETARLLNIPLRDLCTPSTTPYHVVAIKRGDSTIIPGGNDSLQLGDIVYFMTTKKYISTIRTLAGKEDYADVRNVMVMGGGKTAYHVAHGKPDHIKMKIVERNESQCRRMIELLSGNDIRVIQGDARDTRLMLDEGIRDMQAFIALTAETESNILACLAAKRMGVHKTVAMVDNMDYVAMAERLDIGTIINKKTIAASHIYQMMLEADVASVKCLTIANADVSEFVVEEGSPVTQAPVKQLHLPSGVTLGGMVRGGVGSPVGGNTLLQTGDTVVVFSLSGLIKKMDRYFCRPASLLERVKASLT